MTLNDTARALSVRFPALTAREADVLARIAQGWSNATIAASLAMTEKTVKNVALPLALKVGMDNDDRGGSLRVRLALIAHGIATIPAPVA
jgi:DNA-binding NarL/FixJ family response regulator